MSHKLLQSAKDSEVAEKVKNSLAPVKVRMQADQTKFDKVMKGLLVSMVFPLLTLFSPSPPPPPPTTTTTTTTTFVDVSRQIVSP